MICPHCGSPAQREVTGNGGWLYVGEDINGTNSVHDANVSAWRCVDYGHVFYTNDNEGNNP